MRLYKYFALSLLAAAGYAVYAADHDDRNDGQEKVRPSQELLKSTLRRTAQNYPTLLTDGSEDGRPYGLTLSSVSEKEVKLSWLSPEPTDGLFEDFEGHDDFAVNSPGSIGWSYLDGDNKYTYAWQACTFPNTGQKMAFIIMNPWETSPAMDANPNFVPVSGHKMLLACSSIDAPNNDYIISPRLSFDSDFKVSFMARSYNDRYSLERIRVGYSTTGTQPSNFTFVSEGDYVEVPAEWTLYEYQIPKEARYVTINCVSDDAFMLLIDDIFIGTNNIRPGIAPRRAAAANPLVGFNVYRDGVKINTETVTEIRFTDNVPDFGDYTYTVTALYADGTESDASDQLAVSVPDTRLLPFEDDFDDWTLHAEKWSVVNHDGVTTDYWRIDYYEYGLVDPAATYRYSALKNYDQSLVSRDLRTTDREGTYLRFNLKLRNYKMVNTDYLTVEVTSDDGLTWQEVTTFDNTQGPFDWTICQYPIGKQLTSDLFRVRFRAHGLAADYIDYWYVDDVKIWTPQWSTGSLTVSSADGPVAGCPVRLLSDSGADITVTTDASGTASMEQIEEGHYTVSVIHDGYNIYSGTWDVTTGAAANKLDINLTRPVLSLSASEVSADMETESATTRELTLTNTGDGPATWYLNTPMTKNSGNEAVRWNVQKTFKASGDLQNAVAFDGENYYTSSSVTLGEFWKYDRNGNFIEKFTIPEMYYKLYDMTYDGRYFYGSDYSNRLFQLDFANRRIVSIIDIPEAPELDISHCSYDPDRDGFWVGSWTTLAFVNRDGTLGSRLAYFDETASMSVYGSAYDNVTPGGPYLWLANEQTTDENPLDCIQIRQYNLNTRKLTDVIHSAEDVPGYEIGSATSGRNYICGLASSTDVVNGTFSLIGILQQSPSLIFSYALCEADKWLSLEPRHGTIEPGGNQKITVGFDSRYANVGDVFTSSASLLTIPELADQSVSFKLNATSQSATPRPVDLTATPGKAQVALSWQPGSTTNLPQGYDVYRDNVKVNDTPVTETAYTDDNLVYGQYYYKVKALYADGKESLESDSVGAFVKQGAPYYAPLDLTATVAMNRDVTLGWRSPLADADKSASASWSTCEHVDQMGLTSGGYFYAASVWAPEDLTPYRNKTVRSVSVQLVNQCTYLSLQIIKEGEVVYRKTYNGTILYDGTMTEISVDEPVTIEPGYTYYFALQLMNEANMMPLAMDGSEAVNGKGNALSYDGKVWFPATQMAISGNFNIKINLDPASPDAEEAPVGYNIYRDGTKVNSETVTDLTFTDAVETAGRHTYTVKSVYAGGSESGASSPAAIDIINIEGRYAPTTVSPNVHINRDVTLRWSYPTASETVFPTDTETRPVTTDESCPEFVNSFVGSIGEMAIASDNKFIYTSVYGENGRINKYSLSGEYLGNIVIDGLEGIRNLAYDGEYFYAADNLNDIKKIDIEAQTIIETIPVSEYARHLTYIPEGDGGKGAFEVGDWESSIYVSRNGSKIGNGPALAGAAGTAYHDGKLYAFEQGNVDNKYTIGIYDYATGNRTGSINLDSYRELSIPEDAEAGGMSAITTPEGITLLALAVQSNSSTRFVFIEAESVKGVSGYNIYRNGSQLNDAPLSRRYFAETLTTEGDYDYTVETVYIDGTTSEASAPARVTIVPKGEAKTPANVKAAQSSYGYNVLLSFSDPDMAADAALTESFETATAGEPVSISGWDNVNSAWTATTDYAYDQTTAITAAKGTEARLVIPAADMKYLRMAICNVNDHNGNGAIDVLCSTSGTDASDFIPTATYTTTELWRQVTVELPEGTDYVAIRKQAATAAQMVDAVQLFAEKPAERVYAYDIFRDGKQINTEPVEDISYLDRNLMPGRYEYQARLTTMTSAVSELSEKAAIDLSYDNGGLAPTNLKADIQDDGNVQLSWQVPALGSPIYLRWHNGYNYDAAGLPNGGAFFAGVRWLASDLKGYEQMVLTDIEFYINQVPEALFVLVYEGNVLVRQQYVSTLTQYAFNTVHLNDPLALNTSKELRVVIYVEHNEITVPLGYDEGPAKEGRGNLYSSDGTTWTTLSDDDVNIDGNWNIAIGLSPYAETQYAAQTQAPARKLAPKRNAAGDRRMVSAGITSSTSASDKNVLEGYNVYRNNDRLNTEYLDETEYLDTKPHSDKYLEYKVSAVYSASGEKFSDAVMIVPSIIEGISGDDSRVRIEAIEGALRITNAHTGDNVTVYSAAGATVYSGTISDSYVHTISTASLASGTYVVKVGTDTAKFVIR